MLNLYIWSYICVHLCNVQLGPRNLWHMLATGLQSRSGEPSSAATLARCQKYRLLFSCFALTCPSPLSSSFMPFMNLQLCHWSHMSPTQAALLCLTLCSLSLSLLSLSSSGITTCGSGPLLHMACPSSHRCGYG